MTRNATARARPQVEPLEDRQLPAGHITFNPALGIVTVQGTPRNDRLAVSYGPGDTVRVALTGGARQTIRLPASAVNEIGFQGGGGRDRVRDFTAVPVVVATGPARPAAAFRGAPALPVTPAPALTSDEALVLQETNTYRISQGLPPLAVNPSLEQMAQGLASAEAAADRYGDTDTDGHIFQGHDTVWRAGQVGYHWRCLGENVAYNLGYPAPAQELMDQWWNSPEHQANILDPNYTAIGVGVAVGASGRTYGVQDFGAPG